GAHLARLLLLDELERVEALDLGGDLDGELRGVELLDVAHAAAARHQRRPRVGDRVAARRDESETRNHDATFQRSFSLRGSEMSGRRPEARRPPPALNRP